MREIFTTHVPSAAALGYTLYLDGEQVGSRVTSGISPVGTGTGVYRTVIDDTICDLVIWSTGGSAPSYAAEQIESAASASTTFVTPTISNTPAISPVVGGAPSTVISPVLSSH